MGGCIGVNRRSDAIDDSSGSNSRPYSGKLNLVLLFTYLQTTKRSKRDEFWDTAPAFEGRKEIWDALRAAAVAAETKDYELAQAILDGASVSVPNGYLTECYDELGARYQVPIYCLSYPINIVKEDSGRDSPAECSEPVDGGTETILKLRLSHNCTDVKLAVYSTDTISSQEGIESSRQRWFYGGKLLGDKLHVEEAKIPTGYVIQVIVNIEFSKMDS
ncbi:ubiquitin domain containing 1 protein-related [Holotrichia oblita]|uniref:Ubiquitin domain containing 1 protein-related n=1 Tax=Holotrichia oblita TaxID=644536 RepID=A0ACB9STG0_HOLOL|nr:ubiquitin domain containing 1 protein-related [Holotrichia oblita]